MVQVYQFESFILAPYLPEHVEIYHGWMQDPYLLEMTASDPLTLSEEYAMQQRWAVDDDKLTFIVVVSGLTKNRVGRTAEHGGIAGDVNLFITDPSNRTHAEVEVMIAEEECRGCGLGIKAISAILRIGIDTFGIKEYTAKISMKNAACLGLVAKLGFVEVSRSDMFKEITLCRLVDDAFVTMLGSNTGPSELVNVS